MKRLYTDIEVSPYSLDKLLAKMPEFDAPTNYKDPVKIEYAIKEKQQAWLEKATLNPMLSYATTMGYCFNDGEIWIDECDGAQGDENADREITQRFLDLCKRAYHGEFQIWGWNIFEYDLPFIMRRAWKHKLDTRYIQLYRGRYWPEYFIDMRVIWGLGQYQVGGNLGEVAEFLGVGAKNGDGAEFHKLYYGTSEEKLKALAYAKNDVHITKGVGELLVECGFDTNSIKFQQ